MRHLLTLILALVAFTAPAQIVKSGWTSTADAATARTALGFVTTNINEFNTTNNYSVTNTYTVTNWGGLATGNVFVDALAGNDTTGTGAPDAPFASLSNAQASAVSGQTIVAVRGTFSETALGKNGVSWYFADGTILTNTYFVSNGSNPTNRISGRAVIRSVVVSCLGTNNFNYVEAAKIECGTAVMAAFTFGLNSNVLTLKADRIEGAITLPSAGVGLTNVLTVNFHTPDLTFYHTGGAATGQNTNVIFNVWNTGQFLAGATMNLSTYGTFRVYGGRFSRNGKTISGNIANQRWYFYGVGVASTNELPGAGATTNVFGTWTADTAF